jgi:hypothetical protein
MRAGQRGSVTAETAIVLPVVVLMLVTAGWAIGVVVAQLRCVDAARDAARAVARGEPVEEAQRLGARSAPPGATVDVRQAGGDVTVVVTATVDVPVLGHGRPVRVQGHASVQVEPGPAP